MLERVGGFFGSPVAALRTVGSAVGSILTVADRLPNQTELSNWLERISYHGGNPYKATESLLKDGIVPVTYISE